MTKQKPITLVTQKQYADHLGISQQAVNKMVRTGKIPSVHGRIDPEAADSALAPPDAQTDGKSLAEALRRKEWALAGLRENELARKNGEVVEVAYAIKLQERVYVNIRQHLLGLPSKLTPRLVSVSSPALIKNILEREVRQCLEELVTLAAELGA